MLKRKHFQYPLLTSVPGKKELANDKAVIRWHQACSYICTVTAAKAVNQPLKAQKVPLSKTTSSPGYPRERLISEQLRVCHD